MSTTLRCPACGKWLGDVAGYARLVCERCGAETTYKSRQQRRGALTETEGEPSMAPAQPINGAPRPA